MSALNELFDKVFVLTIERNADRHPSVKENLKGVNFEFWYGMDVPVIFPDVQHVYQIPDDFFIKNNIDKSGVSVWTKGQLGAYASITKMISEVEEKYEQVLIFEDDFLTLSKDWQTILKKAVEELPEEWDILLIGYLYYGKAYKLVYRRSLRWIFNLYNSVKKYTGLAVVVKPAPKKYSHHLDTAGTALGGHAYAISNKGAKKLMQHLNPMRVTGDILVKKLIESEELNAYSVYPCLFTQNKLFASKTEVV